jgi:hypothetical protein
MRIPVSGYGHSDRAADSGGLADQVGIRSAHGIVVVLLIAAYLVSRLASRLALTTAHAV